MTVANIKSETLAKFIYQQVVDEIVLHLEKEIKQIVREKAMEVMQNYATNIEEWVDPASGYPHTHRVTINFVPKED